MGYDEQYQMVTALFGSEPEGCLIPHCEGLDRSRPVLDVGAGQGRNTFFLARRGHQVVALEPSKVAAAHLMNEAMAHDLPVTVINHGFNSFEVAEEGCEAVLVFGLIPDLKREEIQDLVQWLHRQVQPGSRVFVTGFTTDDPAYISFAQGWQELSKHSFGNDQGRVRTYLKPGEILQLFPDWQVLHHREKLGPEHCHGESPPERHMMFEAVFQVR